MISRVLGRMRTHQGKDNGEKRQGSQDRRQQIAIRHSAADEVADHQPTAKHQ